MAQAPVAQAREAQAREAQAQEAQAREAQAQEAQAQEARCSIVDVDQLRGSWESGIPRKRPETAPQRVLGFSSLASEHDARPGKRARPGDRTPLVKMAPR